MTDNSESNAFHLLDPEQIKMLLESGAEESVELFTEILSMFEQESTAKLAEMDEALAGKEYETFSRAAHALAGSSANIGGRDVWLKAREMENLCKSGEGEKAAAMLPDLKNTYQETLIQMHQYLRWVQSGES